MMYNSESGKSVKTQTETLATWHLWHEHPTVPIFCCHSSFQPAQQMLSFLFLKFAGGHFTVSQYENLDYGVSSSSQHHRVIVYVTNGSVTSCHSTLIQCF